MTARIRVRVQPQAKTRGAAGFREDGALQLRVREPATDGRANRAVVELLAELLEVKAKDVEVIGGHGSRDKRVEVRGLDQETVRARLATRIAAEGKNE